MEYLNAVGLCGKLFALACIFVGSAIMGAAYLATIIVRGRPDQRKEIEIEIEIDFRGPLQSTVETAILKRHLQFVFE